jgi:predicted RNA binding protein with dsRBD fold (UPF0201 family)
MNALEFIRGLVRPIISIGVVAVVCYLAIVGKLTAERLLELGGIIVAFHYQGRSMDKMIDKLVPKKETEVPFNESTN